MKIGTPMFFGTLNTIKAKMLKMRTGYPGHVSVWVVNCKIHGGRIEKKFSVWLYFFSFW